MRKRIGLKLFAAVGAIFALALGGSCLLYLAAAREAVVEQVADDSLNALRLVWGVIRREMLKGDGKTIGPCLESVASKHNLVSLALYAPDGVPVAAAPGPRRQGLSSARPSRNGACRSCHGSSAVKRSVADTAWVVTTRDRQQEMRTVLHARNETACQPCHGRRDRFTGVLVADSSLARAQAIQGAIARRSALFAAAVFVLLGTVLAWLVRRLVHRPLTMLEQATARIAAGDFNHRVAPLGSDEFSRLALAFNQMTSRLGEMTTRLEALATTDHLTSLPNHRHFQERLKEEVGRAERYGRCFALLMLDMDRFKAVNDVHGHQAGDQVLTQIAALLRDCVRASDIVARYGGEEFAVILPEKTAVEATQVAERIRLAVQEHVFRVHARPEDDPSGAQIRLTVSIGVAEFPADSARPEGLVMAADVALMRTKHMSRNVVCAYSALAEAGESDDAYLLHQSLQQGTFESVAALVEALEARDSYTRGHSARVASFATAVARRLGLSEQEVNALHLAGLLHDVGKIGIPDSVLAKPAQLTPDERRLMETHPGVGGSIIKTVSRLAGLLPIILHHHERYDGHGYPSRLQGESIPLASRILAAADACDAMLSARPYRPALTKEQVVQELADNAGSQFDPRVIEALVSYLAEAWADEPLAAKGGQAIQFP